MREILFRGKHMLVGPTEFIWVYGSLVTYPSGSAEIHTEDGRMLPVLLGTIGQYTGLQDKNGEKIFEDDIVCWPKEDGYGHVYWAKDEARFVIEFEGCIVDFDNLWGHEIEVYGNIHDNPELLGR